MNPPRIAELLLRGLIADPRLEQAVLGDLAEEWSERRLRDGPYSGDRWYWHQGVRTLPYLLRAWWKGTRRRTVLGTLCAALVGFVFLLFLNVIANVVVLVAAETRGLHWGSAVASLAAAAVAGLCSGAAVTWLTRRKLVSAFLIGAACVVISFLIAGTGVEAIPQWYWITHWIALAAILFTATIVGGILVIAGTNWRASRRHARQHRLPKGSA